MSIEALEDAALVREAATGHELAFEVLVRRHTEAAWRLARSLLPDDFAAEEAVQDTFVKAYRALGTFRGDAAVRTWLLAICYRACMDRLRLKRERAVPLDSVPEQRMEGESPDLRLTLEQALEELSEDERRAFVLVHVLSYTREEAAAICQVPASTMRSRVLRARERLAQIIAAAEGGDGRGSP